MSLLQVVAATVLVFVSLLFILGDGHRLWRSVGVGAGLLILDVPLGLSLTLLTFVVGALVAVLLWRRRAPW